MLETKCNPNSTDLSTAVRTSSARAVLVACSNTSTASAKGKKLSTPGKPNRAFAEHGLVMRRQGEARNARASRRLPETRTLSSGGVGATTASADGCGEVHKIHSVRNDPRCRFKLVRAFYVTCQGRATQLAGLSSANTCLTSVQSYAIRT